MKKIIFVASFLTITLSFNNTPVSKNGNIGLNFNNSIDPISDTLNINNLKLLVDSIPFKHGDIIVAQAILETGWFKSKNCIKNNNLFGMRKSYIRPSTSDTTIDGYAHYSNWKLSVIDYYILQQYLNPKTIDSRYNYFRYLDNIFSQSGRKYSIAVMNIIEKINK
jgi:uncharacterized FlgJ-related protein